MAYNNWEQFGDEVKNSIWNAVETGDFSSLSRTVSNTINQALGGFTGQGQPQNQGYSYNGQANENNRNGSYNPNDTSAQNGSAYQHERSGASGNANTSYYQNTTGQAGSYAVRNQASSGLYVTGTSQEIGGAALTALGGIGAFCFLALLVMLYMIPWMPWIVLIIVALLACGCGAAAVSGVRKLGRLKRFRQYVALLSNREYADVKALAQQAGLSVKVVTKDLRKMISRGWFRQGYLDESGSCLMVSNRAHQQYLELMDRKRKEKEEEEARARVRQQQMQQQARGEEERRRQEEERYAHLSPEVREIIRTGNDYVVKVHKLNDEIPGEEVSAKISRMELVLARIFDRVEKHPESANDMRRLMDYYLPMTVKLLEAYRDMDAQPIQPANIVSSKAEIEKTLDTLNAAFEKLLDDLFMDTAWDLSSDISVLNTLLAQDGLTKDSVRS